MSTTLGWRPSDAYYGLPNELRIVLQKSDRYDRTVTIGMVDRPYFEALRDAGIDGAQQVVEAISNHHSIELLYSP